MRGQPSELDRAGPEMPHVHQMTDATHPSDGFSVTELTMDDLQNPEIRNTLLTLMGSFTKDKVPDDAERLAQNEAYLGGTIHSMGSGSRKPGQALLLRKARDGVEENCGLLLSTHSLMHFSRDPAQKPLIDAWTRATKAASSAGTASPASTTVVCPLYPSYSPSNGYHEHHILFCGTKDGRSAESLSGAAADTQATDIANVTELESADEKETIAATEKRSSDAYAQHPGLAHLFKTLTAGGRYPIIHFTGDADQIDAKSAMTYAAYNFGEVSSQATSGETSSAAFIHRNMPASVLPVFSNGQGSMRYGSTTSKPYWNIKSRGGFWPRQAADCRDVVDNGGAHLVKPIVDPTAEVIGMRGG